MRKPPGRIFFGLALTALFLLPLRGGVGAEQKPFEDPEGFFTVILPDGWTVEDSGYMGKGVIMKGPAGKGGGQPAVSVIHEPSGILALDVQWHTRLGQIRYDLERVRFLGLEDHEDRNPPYSHAKYSYVSGAQNFVAMVRLYKHDSRFFLFSASAPEEEFESLAATFMAVFDSFRPGTGE
jgi:hypothetical protein